MIDLVQGQIYLCSDLGIRKITEIYDEIIFYAIPEDSETFRETGCVHKNDVGIFAEGRIVDSVDEAMQVDNSFL